MAAPLGAATCDFIVTHVAAMEEAYTDNADDGTDGGADLALIMTMCGDDTVDVNGDEAI